jgi:hypothetical protein
VTIVANSCLPLRASCRSRQVWTKPVACRSDHARGKVRWQCEKRDFHGWHRACYDLDTAESTENDMSNFASMSINPLFLRHDLMIELGRLEMAMDSARCEPQREDAIGQLETRFAKINEALSRLPA